MKGCLVVFAAGYDDRGNLDRETISRLKTARGLWLGEFLVTGGVHNPVKDSVIADEMKDWLVIHGVPEYKIYVENSSYDTWSNVLNSLSILRDCKEIILVSNGWHLKRILFIFKILRIKRPWLRKVRILRQVSSPYSVVTGRRTEFMSWLILFFFHPRWLKRFIYTRFFSAYRHLR